ncbi:hypothetical protein ILUMI_08483 [Ignelater luminosus]|uniref:PUM-HD domain-containing protein n=1 Tax=Ignelater luminosus TaxID=2038154 RepID=A0A8K0GFD3_IGNLU|nr:hypothetical protein ILUMI_08483 [Ignelater luminosus]
MIRKSKRASTEQTEETSTIPKKIKKNTQDDSKVNSQDSGDSKVKKVKNIKTNKDGKIKKTGKSPPKNYKSNNSNTEKTNWNEFKMKKKELKMKRKQAKGMYDVVVEAKKIAEALRVKHLKGGNEERNKLVNQLHGLLYDKDHYSKLVLSHDMARVVQYLLKFGSENVRNNIAKELIPVSVDMLQSKYGRYCFKNMLKYGNGETRSAAINTLYGHAVKLTSHVVSAANFEYAYSTWASPQQKQHLIQEFFGDMYRQAKDNTVKHLRDVYKDSPSMKNGVLSATKANLSRILNKDLLDSQLVQSVLHQFITECSNEDRTELISQLSPHVVIISNSKDGARVAMNCIWHGSNKDRKIIVKALKEHTLDLCKHEHGHCTVITILDAADDTVLVNKLITSQILTHAKELATDEWGRKVLLWLTSPADHTHFHPIFIKELEDGRQTSTSKKEVPIRRKELLQYCSPDLLKLIHSDSSFWLSTASVAFITVSVLKSGTNEEDFTSALESVAKVIVDSNWKIKEEEKDIMGIEHAGLHMILKKLAQHDKMISETCNSSFGKSVLDLISDETIKIWLTLNRGCFLLVTIYENGTESVQKQIKEKLKSHLSFLKKQKSSGAQILLKKFK